MLAVLAADSMEGRAAGTAGADRAARWIEERMREYGLEPGVGGSYRQVVPLVEMPGPDGKAVVLLDQEGGVETTGIAGTAGTAATAGPGGTAGTAGTAGTPGTVGIPGTSGTSGTAGTAGHHAAEGRRFEGVNLVGVVQGADPGLRDEAVVVGAHYDHEGIGPTVNGDSIYNGADDDGSGVVAVLAAARALASGPPPRRTVVFLLTTAEEHGILGTAWYVRHPVVPLERTVADLQVEMVGRPDSLAGGPGRFWLTGYERSTMGESLAAAGISVVADPRPQFQFFRRSDNIVFALEGIPAHTLSSFNLHADYHQPSDEVEGIDFDHLAEAAAAVTRAARVLADGERPEWRPGGRPEPSTP